MPPHDKKKKEERCKKSHPSVVRNGKKGGTVEKQGVSLILCPTSRLRDSSPCGPHSRELMSRGNNRAEIVWCLNDSVEGMRQKFVVCTRNNSNAIIPM